LIRNMVLFPHGIFEPNSKRKNFVMLTGAEVTRILFKPETDLEDSKAPRLAKAVKFVLGGQ